MATVVRRTVRARDIPPSWNVPLPGDPDAPVTVVIMPGGDDAGDVRPLTSFIRAGKGVFGSPEQADGYIRESRDAWDSGKAKSTWSDSAFSRIYQDAQEHTKSGVLRQIFDHSRK